VTTLTLQQVAAYARGAGFYGDALVDIVAVATPESSLSTTAVNSSSGAVGLWQINQPVHVQDHPGWTRQWLMDPINNAAAAKIIYDQQGMGAWEAWTTGRAQPYMEAARQAVQAVGGGTSTGTTATPADDTSGSSVTPASALDSLNKLGDVAKALASMTTLMISAAAWMADSKNWGRVVWIVLGGGLIVAGLQKAGLPVNTALSAIKKVTP
jgi:hypothetical protein